MSGTVRKPTKQGSLTTAFLREAASKPVEALAYMLLQAFGVSLASLMGIAVRALQSEDTPIIVMALTAGVQIRAHVVFVGREFGDIRARYPELVIEGEREQRDIFNFGAMHALGHVFSHMSRSDIASKILHKAGSCITGEFSTESEAGKINKEISTGWTSEDKARWAAEAPAIAATHSAVLERVVNTLPTLASTFARTLAPPAGGRPAAGPPVGGRPAGAAT